MQNKINISIEVNGKMGRLNTQIYIDGEWVKEISGATSFIDLFELFSENKDLLQLINETKRSPLSNIKGDFFKRNLSEKEKEFLLYKLFGLSFDESGVLYDEEGDDFYENVNNQHTDFNTLEDIFVYHEYYCKIKGKNQFRSEFEKLMKHDII